MEKRYKIVFSVFFSSLWFYRRSHLKVFSTAGTAMRWVTILFYVKPKSNLSRCSGEKSFLVQCILNHERPKLVSYASSQKPSSVCHIHCLVHRCFKHETVSYLHFFSKVNSNIFNASILFVAVLFSKNSQQILTLN